MEGSFVEVPKKTKEEDEELSDDETEYLNETLEKAAITRVR
jgi:hypothetical protein